jgi:predicted GNAT family acetyltransferase
MPDGSTDAVVTDDKEQRRYELHVDGQLAGFAEYELRAGRIVFTHTEIDPAFEGHGLGGRLAKAALDDARARHLRVIARCPFIAEYVRRHPDYADLTTSQP